MTECQICFETFHSNQIGKVGCGSSVDHYLCFGCEKTWRSKMPLQNGLRIMNCPTCRQPEKYRTIESLQRETTTSQPTDYSALITAEMSQANRVVQIIQRVEAERAAQRAVARAAAPRQVVSTITREELDVINARLMGRAASVTERASSVTERAASVTREVVVVDAPARPARSRCASGRNCRSTSQSGRSMTHLKCTHCNTVFCCRTCSECVGCRPFPSYMLPYVEQLRL